MPKFLLIVDHRRGVIETPMEEWGPHEVRTTWTTTRC